MAPSTLRSVAKNLRYKTIESLIGRTVTISSRHNIAEATSALLATELKGCQYINPDERVACGQIGKYGMLDLEFDAPIALVEQGFLSGIPLLRSLGFIDESAQEILEKWEVDSGFCIDELHQDLTTQKGFVKLYLKNTDSTDLSLHERMKRTFKPETIPFPMTFVVTDACLANSSRMWIHKHFYMLGPPKQH